MKEGAPRPIKEKLIDSSKKVARVAYNTVRENPYASILIPILLYVAALHNIEPSRNDPGQLKAINIVTAVAIPFIFLGNHFEKQDRKEEKDRKSKSNQEKTEDDS